MQESRVRQKLDQGYRIDILEMEKIKLHEEVDYLTQQIDAMTSEYSDNMLAKEQELVNAQITLQEVSAMNRDLLQKLNVSKKSEDMVNQTNHNFVQLQKKLNQKDLEIQTLTQKYVQSQQNAQQFQEKWQRCSHQLKSLSQAKCKYKDVESTLDKKLEEYSILKEKYSQVQLELTILKQSEAEYKESVSKKIQSLLEQLSQAQYESQLMKTFKDQTCQQCHAYQQEIQHLKQILNTDTINIEQNKLSQSMNYQLQSQVHEQYQRILELELERESLIRQQQQQSLTQKYELPQTMHNKTVKQSAEYVKLQKLVESIKDPIQKELFKRTVGDLVQQIENKDNMLQQLQECKTMYDRLVVKYYSLQKSQLNIEVNEQPTTLIKKPQESFFSQQDTSKQLKKTFEQTPKQVSKRRTLNMSFDSVK